MMEASKLMICFLVPNLLIIPTFADMLDIDRSTAEVVQSRGFIAVEHHVTTSKGNILSLVQAKNPLIKEEIVDKDAILMVHGTASNSKYYTVNSDGARPVDYSNLNAGLMSVEKLLELLEDDPSRGSLVFLALNFGHEVWLLNRRGTDESVNLSIRPEQSDKAASSKRSLKEMNARYWNYSLDEQALIDLPIVMDYILDRTYQPKLSYVGQSSGCNLLLMQLSTLVHYADKISSAVLWAPALYPVSPVSACAGLFAGPPAYIGPVYIFRAFQKPLEYLCAESLSHTPLCRLIPDMLFGFGGEQQQYKPEHFDALLNLVSSHELSQLGQAAVAGKTFAYNFEDPKKNLKAYGQVEPPLYNVSRIKLETISVWSGQSDALSTQRSIKKLVSDFRVPVETHYFNLPRLLFTHESFLTHKDAARHVIIPSLQTIESKGMSDRRVGV